MTTEHTDLQATMRAYLDAFERRDLPCCVDFFTDDAAIDFVTGVYRGRQAIEEWHRDRFAADLRIIRVDDMRAQGDAVVVDGVITSKVARMWRFPSLSGTATFRFQDGRIAEAKFGLRTRLPFEGW